jgi:hypothetical protein
MLTTIAVSAAVCELQRKPTAGNAKKKKKR